MYPMALPIWKKFSTPGTRDPCSMCIVKASTQCITQVDMLWNLVSGISISEGIRYMLQAIRRLEIREYPLITQNVVGSPHFHIARELCENAVNLATRSIR